MAASADVSSVSTKKPCVQFPTKVNHLKNKTRRREEIRKYLEEKKQAHKKKKKEIKALGDAAPPKGVPRTIENTRRSDVTMVDPEDEEVRFDEATDEMASYFRKEKEPKIVITTCDNPHTNTNRFCRELSRVIPNCHYRFRTRASIKKMSVQAVERGFTDIIIINEDRRKPNALLLIHLPEGPTAYFRMSNVMFCKDIEGSGKLTKHRPEVILNNFNTRLGHSAARMFASIFHFDPQFHGRRVVTFHNQRDYIFFRHHRYEFRNEKKVGLHELGPRFTLKLKTLQKGTFDTKFGEFEWTQRGRAVSKRRFYL